MADFTNNLALVNGLAERSTGFVWRYIDESGQFDRNAPLRRSAHRHQSRGACSRWQPKPNLGMAGERSGALQPPIIQVGRPFAEHLRTWPGVLDAGKGPV